MATGCRRPKSATHPQSSKRSQATIRHRQFRLSHRNPVFETRVMPLKPIAFVQFTDGMRPVYEENGRQFTYDNEGERVYGVWYIPPDECIIPMIVAAAPTSPSEPSAALSPIDDTELLHDP